jgi:hypothetical protein
MQTHPNMSHDHVSLKQHDYSINDADPDCASSADMKYNGKESLCSIIYCVSYLYYLLCMNFLDQYYENVSNVLLLMKI